ncbi:hypothetical protein B4135_1811 [Caldibacillus debilis]|uniref:Uncharacterized protein n=1 Tax=Caldibacillus debilis TaxID=301148 RepID=A0A150M7L8_9BACI|nr:hypothetical protein B4135_1811 [Caldibacillus debilis]
MGTSPEPYEPQDQAACLPQEVLRGKGVQKQMTIKSPAVICQGEKS